MSSPARATSITLLVVQVINCTLVYTFVKKHTVKKFNKLASKQEPKKEEWGLE